MSAPHPEVFLACGYAAFLLVCAGALEWLSAHTHRRALRFRTAGFAYDERLDAWHCPEGQPLWPHEFDQAPLMVEIGRAHV